MQRAGLNECGGRVSLLDVHVVGVGAEPHRVQADRLISSDAVRQAVDHVILVAIERLEEERHALGCGVPPSSPRASTRTARSSSGERGGSKGGSRRENIPYDAGVMAPRPPSSAITDSCGVHLRHGVPAQVGVEVADEVAHLDADRRHGYAGGGCSPQLGQPGSEGQVARPAQLDAVEAPAWASVPFLLEAVAGQAAAPGPATMVMFGSPLPNSKTT